MKLTPPSRAASTLTLGMVTLLATTIFAQQLSTKASDDGKTAKLVADMISQYHIKQSEINDNISSHLLDTYLKQLDPQRLYFTQDDVDSLDRFRNQLDDMIKAGNVEFATIAYDLYLKRLDERIQTAQRWIDAEHDFTVDESMSVDFDKMPWAKNAQEIDERWLETSMLYHVGQLLQAAGRLPQAIAHFAQAVDLAENIGHPKLEDYRAALDKARQA